MKKSLFAIAAVTAFAGAAQAQSSVTVYGIIDAGFVGSNSRLSSNSTAYGAQGGTKTTANGFTGKGAETSSRLGFKGTEDLGGGASAFFTYEIGMYPEDQALSGNTNGGLENRQSFVGLKKNGIGQVAIGLQYTPVFNASAATDPGQHNNIAGDLIYSAGGSATLKDSANNTVNASFTNRTANTLSFKSDNFAGFTVSGIYSLANSNTTQLSSSSGGMTNANGWGLAADYTWKKLYVTAAYQALKQVTNSSTTVTPWGGSQPSAGLIASGSGVGATTSNASNIQDNQFLAGATYDFGILKAYAQYVNRKATSALTPDNYAKRSAEQIGVRSYITPTIEAWGSAGLGRYTAYGAGQPTVNMNGWQLGSNYYLSKRTNLYAIYGQQIMTTGTTTSGSVVSAGGSQYALGLRHTF